MAILHPRRGTLLRRAGGFKFSEICISEG